MSEFLESLDPVSRAFVGFGLVLFFIAAALLAVSLVLLVAVVVMDGFGWLVHRFGWWCAAGVGVAGFVAALALSEVFRAFVQLILIVVFMLVVTGRLKVRVRPKE